jgi:long-chain acyl-CoA synthetase
MRKFIYGYQPGMRALLTGPLYHSAPNMYGTFTLKFDGTLYLMPRFDAEQTLAMIAHKAGLSKAPACPADSHR